MAFEIVDGMTGTKHISSDDLSALNVATIGKANCVLKYGDDFKLTMASANSATLGTGVGMVGGKRFWNQAATSLTIQSGTQGQKRNDLVVARYAKTSAGIESITPVVIKGNPSTGTAADPATTSNDLKLWRIQLNGISVGTPVRLFDSVASLATLRDSVSKCTRLWYRNYTTGTEPSAITFTAPGGLDSYDYLVFFGKTSEHRRTSVMLSRDGGFGTQYFQLAAPYAPTGGTDIYERVTGYEVTFSGENVTVSPRWYNEVHFSANGCEVSKGKGVPLYEVVGIKRLF